MSFSQVLPPSLWFYLQFVMVVLQQLLPVANRSVRSSTRCGVPQGRSGKREWNSSSAQKGAAPEKSSPQPCPEHVPPSWEAAGAGEEAAAALRNQLWVGQSSGCRSGAAALGLPQAATATCTSVTVLLS